MLFQWRADTLRRDHENVAMRSDYKESVHFKSCFQEFSRVKWFSTFLEILKTTL